MIGMDYTVTTSGQDNGYNPKVESKVSRSREHECTSTILLNVDNIGFLLEAEIKFSFLTNSNPSLLPSSLQPSKLLGN